MNHNRLLLALMAASLGVGCSTEAPVPPLFNAIDRSISCGEGLVGWDFSTGGFEDDVRNVVLSNELRIVEATYGGSCSVTPGNWTTKFAAACNGNVTCSRGVSENTDQDPAPGCSKNFVLKYSCGVEGTVYQISENAEAGPKQIKLQCGEIITIGRASYGLNVKPETAGNLTTKLAAICSGGRRCIAPTGLELLGADPAPGQGKNFVIEYFCGNSRESKEIAYVDGFGPNFECPVKQTAPSLTINVLQATYGGNTAVVQNNLLPFSYRGNATQNVRDACNGKVGCVLEQLGGTVIADPAPGFSKMFEVDYTCGSTINRLAVKAEAGSKRLFLACGELIKIVAATYGAPGDSSGNFTAQAQKRCDQQNICQFQETGIGLFGSDPAPGVNKRFTFTYLCGNDSAARTVNYGENDPIAFACPPPSPRPEAARGLRVVEATMGANCTSADQKAIKNNALGLVTQSCYGKDTCDFNFNGIGFDPVPNCFKHLKVDYRCGDDSEVRSATLEAQSGRLALTCEPAVKIASARFGSGCGGVADNALSLVKQACENKRGSCRFKVNSLFGDPFPGCAKDFTASYSCGADPTIKKVDLPAEASFSEAVFSCPATAQPYARKECVPTSCLGRQRRNADLKCVTDLTKPVVPAFGTVSLTAVNSATKTNLGQYQENVPVDLTLTVNTGQLPTSFKAGSELGNAVVWAFDTFTPNGGGSEVVGFRCLLANVGLRVGAGNQLVGKTTGTVIPPACFGQNVASWGDAAKRLGMNEVIFRSKYTLSKPGATRVSVDPEGKLVMLGRPTGATAETAMVPNPVGFFYDAPKLWVDSVGYYRQTEVPSGALTYTQRPFVDSTTIDLYANTATVSNAEMRISVAEDYLLPTLELDFNWSLQGDAPGRNPFSITAPRLDNSILTLADRKLGVTVEMTKKSLYDQRGSRPWVSRANSMVVGTVQGLKLREGVPNGKTDRVLAEFSPALRERLLRVGGDGWMESATQVLTEFVVRVCLDMDGTSRGETDDTAGLVATRGGVTYAARFINGRRCTVANQIVLVKRDMTIKPLPIPRPNDSAAQVGKSADQGDSTVATGTDFGGQDSCQKQCTVNADCLQGQLCKRPNNVDQGLGLCTGTSASASACTNLTREEMGSEGTGGRSQFSLSTEGSSRRDPNGTAHAEGDASAELLGYDVLDASNGGAEEEEAPYSVGWKKFTISLVPNFDIIEAAMKGEQLVSKPIKPIGKAYHIPPVEGVEREGLSVGIALEVQLWLGPVPVVAVLSASVSLGFGLELEIEVNKEAEGESNSPLYPCFGSNNCIKPNNKVQTLKAANAECALMGGRLADARSDAAFDAVKTAAETAMTATNSTEAWMGAQVGYQYTLPECWQYYKSGTPTSNCINTAKVKSMWVSDGAAFAEAPGNGAAVLTSDTKLLGSNRAPFQNMLGAPPHFTTMAGLAYGKQLPSGTAAGVRAVVANAQRPSVCEFEPAKSYDAVKVGLKASVEASAGFGFEVCTPNSAYGFCLAAAIKLIFAEVSLAYSFSNNDVFGLNNKLMRNVQVHTIEGAWKWGFLAGSVSAALKLLFFNIEWEIAKYEGLQATAQQAAQGLGYDLLNDKFGAPLFKESLTISRKAP